jgi:hypothetical protein
MMTVSLSYAGASLHLARTEPFKNFLDRPEKLLGARSRLVALPNVGPLLSGRCPRSSRVRDCDGTEFSPLSIDGAEFHVFRRSEPEIVHGMTHRSEFRGSDIRLVTHGKRSPTDEPCRACVGSGPSRRLHDGGYRITSTVGKHEVR